MIFLSITFDLFLNLNIIIFLISQSLFPTGMFILASNYIYIFIFFFFFNGRKWPSPAWRTATDFKISSEGRFRKSSWPLLDPLSILKLKLQTFSMFYCYYILIVLFQKRLQVKKDSSVLFILKSADEAVPEACFVVVAGVRLLGRRKALAVMPLDDGCFRDPKLRTPAIKAAQTRPSGRLSSRSKTERGETLRCAVWKKQK